MTFNDLFQRVYIILDQLLQTTCIFDTNTGDNSVKTFNVKKLLHFLTYDSEQSSICFRQSEVIETNCSTIKLPILL